MKVVIYWRTANKETIRRIREKFGIPYYTSVNGETFADISESDMPLLLRCEQLGYVQLRAKKQLKSTIL